MAEKLEIDWDAQPLGVVSDTELSEMLGTHSSTVRRHRSKRGIPKSTKRKRYSSRHIVWEFLPLGLFGDMTIANAIGVNRKTVRANRELLGIKPRKPRSRINWKKVDLGTDTDPNIAKRIGISSSEVCRMRREAGIPAFDNTFMGRVKKENIPLGSMTDADVARRYGGISAAAVGSVRRKFGIPEYTEPCSVCGRPTRIRRPGQIRSCSPCSNLLGNERTLHPEEKASMHVLRAKATLLSNLTEEKILKRRGTWKP